jgi:hypothetical protein
VRCTISRTGRRIISRTCRPPARHRRLRPTGRIPTCTEALPERRLPGRCRGRVDRRPAILGPLPSIDVPGAVSAAVRSARGCRLLVVAAVCLYLLWIAYLFAAVAGVAPGGSGI